jgi:hypothetical protein
MANKLSKAQMGALRKIIVEPQITPAPYRFWILERTAKALLRLGLVTKNGEHISRVGSYATYYEVYPTPAGIDAYVLQTSRLQMK